MHFLLYLITGISSFAVSFWSMWQEAGQLQKKRKRTRHLNRRFHKRRAKARKRRPTEDENEPKDS